ncbi:hypothetical protein S7S_18375 [Isoalcanivorax pacificus W11-5]|uniref:Uncharacterized protein n=1 Tax=Isoalcanivorax pacificus W11-5 TaxID=391936 RepID=A0A0B4XV04_9GAMM|nr:hypothetical protein S7S_18375 [Isoalcanivorax pacificus W11-5]
MASCAALDDPNANKALEIISVKGDGRVTTLHKSPNCLPDYELTLGFDFGTSSTKVVIGDPQQDKAFAIPFLEANGIERYLLPGRLFRDRNYSLVKGKESFRDLKLALMGSKDDKHREHVVAFMALAIRHARAWLFESYETLYSDKHIFWNFAVGMPSKGPRGGEAIKDMLELLALAAWIASTDAEIIDSSSVQNAIFRATTERTKSTPNPELPNILIHPEVNAQIYSFISGMGAFDPKGRNVYLLVDIGAGTIDTSLFHVNRSAGGRWNFTPFTSEVEFNGAINLHRSRMNWWMKAVLEHQACRKDLAVPLERALLNMDCCTRVPPTHDDYVTDSEIQWTRPDEHPDDKFMSKRVRPQILDKTCIEAWRLRRLEKEDIYGVPAFLCGGGMRMPFYKKLLTILDRREQNASWVHVKPQRMPVPERLEAKGLPAVDYDRLSVAYGLSLMESETGSADELVARNTEKMMRDDLYISKEMT